MNKLKFRSMFIAPKDKYLLQVDLSQAESWIVGWESKDENLKYSLQNGDIHTDTATIIFDVEKSKIDPKGTQRYLAKRINHGSAYGMREQRQAEIINKDADQPPYLTVTVPQVKGYQDKWHGHFWRVREWHGEIRDQLRQDRTLITTYGRKRVFYGQMPNTDTGEFWKEAYAYKPQSTVADHFTGLLHPELQIPGGMKEIWKQVCGNSYREQKENIIWGGIPTEITKTIWEGNEGEIKMINMSHDSLILEVPRAAIRDIAERCKKLLERPLIINGESFTIPVDAEYGERNGEWEKIKAA